MSAPNTRPRQGSTLFGAVLAIFIGWGLSGVGAAVTPGLVVRSAEGLTVLDAAGDPVLVADGGQISPDGGVIVAADAGTSGTRVVASDTATGAQRWSREVPGRHEVRLVARGGTAAVLGPPRVSVEGAYIPEGRRRTRLAVVGPSGTRQFHLRGNFEPEAMSLDGSSVFLIQYRPARAPQSYQVRRLDLATGEVVDVFTPDEELQQEMGGTARTQAASADGRRLYTLYTLATGDGSHAHAFIHVLDLDQLWAHCVDLPPSFTGSGESTALALSPDGASLFVADRAAGAIAEIDTGNLETIRSMGLWRGADGDAVHAAVAARQHVLVTSGARIDVLDLATLEPATSIAMPWPVTALQVSDADEVFVGLHDRILTVDRETGMTLRGRRWRDRGPIIGLGTAPGRVRGLREAIDCAC